MDTIKNQTSLNIILQRAKVQLITATTDIMRREGIPAMMMDGILSSLLADIRAQENADLINDFNNHQFGGETGNE